MARPVFGPQTGLSKLECLRLDEIEPQELSLPLDRQALTRLLEERCTPVLSKAI